MKSIVGIAPGATDAIVEAWQWIDSQVNVAEIPDDLRLPFRLCFQTTVCELISRYYVEGLDQNEYLKTFTSCHVEDVIRSVFEYDYNESILTSVNDAVDEVAYEPNTFWALVISQYLNKRMGGPVVTEREDNEEWSDNRCLIMAVINAMSTIIEMAIEQFEIAKHLTELPKRLNVDNVEVNLSSNCIIIWS